MASAPPPILHGFAVLVAKLDEHYMEPGAWHEVARADTEQEAMRIAHELRTNDGVARIVDVCELEVVMWEAKQPDQ